MIANHQGQDGNPTIGEKVRTTVTAKEKEEEQLRATHDVDTVAEGRRKRRGIADRRDCRMRMTRRRKANEGDQAGATKTTATVEEDEAKTGKVIMVSETGAAAA